MRKSALSLTSVFQRIYDLVFPAPATSDAEFARSNNLLLLHRLKLVSLALVLFFICYLFADFVLFKDVQNDAFIFTLVGIHMGTFLASILYLFIYRTVKSNPAFWTSGRTAWLLNFYVLLHLTSGMLASLNSQRLTGNVDAYIMIMLAAAVLVPIKPKHYIGLIALCHAVFLTRFLYVSSDDFTLVAKLINTSATAIISCLIVITFYSHRRREFLSNRRLRENESNIRKLFEVNPYPLILTRVKDGKTLMINAKAISFYHLSSDQPEDFNASFIFRYKDDKNSIMEQLLQRGSIQNYVTELMVSPDVYRWVMLNYELIDYANEQCVLTGVADINELKKMEDELNKYASTDMLSGVMNRRRGIERLQQELEEARQGNAEFIVCFIDVNGLKEVNDQYGHAAGDYLIRTVAKVIENEMDTEDIFFRYGGDEFVILFTRKQMPEVQAVWLQVKRAFEELNAAGTKPFTISVSFGLFIYNTSMNLAIDQIIGMADQEMYKDKSSYKQ
jgi:diguanylate cyclase (GGDEF)-like protein